MRKVLAAVVLIGAVLLLDPKVGPKDGFDWTVTLFLGAAFAVLVAFALGQVFAFLRLPSLTGYVITGFLLGPAVASWGEELWRATPFKQGILSAESTGQLQIIEMLALGVIIFSLGGQLRLRALRHDLKMLSGFVLAQIGVLVLLGLGFVWCLSGPLGAINLPELVGARSSVILGLGVLLGLAASLTSPEATLAVTETTDAEGPMTSTVLSVVAVKDFVATLAFTATVGVLLAYVHPSSRPLAVAAISSLGQALLGGIILGVLIAAYCEYIDDEGGLVVLFAIYVSTLAAKELELNQFALFLTGGFLAANLGKGAEKLSSRLRRIVLPAFVVFFTFAGSKLNLPAIAHLAPFAVGFVFLRALALWLSGRLAARGTSVDPNTQRLGWLAFISQAALTLGLAELLLRDFGNAGETIGSLIAASVGFNLLLGPVLFRFALGIAGEPSPVGPPREDGKSTRPGAPRDWEPSEPWGPPARTSSEELNRVIRELEADLQAVVRDLEQDVLEPLRSDGEAYFKDLRREFLRFHRRTTAATRSEERLSALPPLYWREVRELSENLREAVLDRGARLTSGGFQPERLVAAVDRIVDNLPQWVEVPYEQESFEIKDSDSQWIRLSRRVLRLKLKAHAMMGAEMPKRKIALGELARYHLSGQVPINLEGLAALLIRSEEHLAKRAKSVFSSVVTGYGQICEVLEEDTDRKIAINHLTAIQAEIEADFANAKRDLADIGREGTLRATQALGQGLASMKQELGSIGTASLPAQARSYGRAHSTRAQGMKLLTDSYRLARQSSAAYCSVTALDLELLGLEQIIKIPLEEHGSNPGRLIKGRGQKQLERAQAAADQAEKQVEALLAREDLGGAALGVELREILDSFSKVVADTSHATAQLRADLADERAATPLLDKLLQHASRLTDRYTIPSGRRSTGEWKLPLSATTVQVGLRSAVVGLIETTITRRVLALTREYAERTNAFASAMAELERVTTFNWDVACSEIEVFAEEPVPEEVRASAREMLVNALGRGKERLGEVLAESREWPDELQRGFTGAVFEPIEELRDRINEGRTSELRFGLLRDGARRRLMIDADGVRGLRGLSRERVRTGLKSLIGEPRLDALRTSLGLRLPEREEAINRDVFTSELPSESLPATYRRLFSWRAIESGDLLAAYERDIVRARETLSNRDSDQLRTVAVVGADDLINSIIVSALTRGLQWAKIRRLDLAEPVSPEAVRAWFQDESPNQITVLSGLEWLFEMRPGGFEPLRQLVSGMLENRGEDAWILNATTSIWDYASRSAPLGEAFAERIFSRPMNLAQMKHSILERHQMSGLGLSFETEDRRSLRRLLRSAQDHHQRVIDAWFRQLHDQAEGRLSIGLQLWLGAVTAIDDERRQVRVGPVPRSLAGDIRRLSDDELLTLRVLNMQGWITPRIHGALFRIPELDSSAKLSHLRHLGLLESDEDGRYFVSARLEVPLLRVLRERGWIS